MASVTYTIACFSCNNSDDKTYMFYFADSSELYQDGDVSGLFLCEEEIAEKISHFYRKNHPTHKCQFCGAINEYALGDFEIYGKSLRSREDWASPIMKYAIEDDLYVVLEFESMQSFVFNIRNEVISEWSIQSKRRAQFYISKTKAFIFWANASRPDPMYHPLLKLNINPESFVFDGVGDIREFTGTLAKVYYASAIPSDFDLINKQVEFSMDGRPPLDSSKIESKPFAILSYEFEDFWQATLEKVFNHFTGVYVVEDETPEFENFLAQE